MLTLDTSDRFIEGSINKVKKYCSSKPGAVNIEPEHQNPEPTETKQNEDEHVL